MFLCYIDEVDILVKRYFYDNVTENNYLELIDFTADDINELFCIINGNIHQCYAKS